MINNQKLQYKNLIIRRERIEINSPDITKKNINTVILEKREQKHYADPFINLQKENNQPELN